MKPVLLAALCLTWSAACSAQQQPAPAPVEAVLSAAPWVGVDAGGRVQLEAAAEAGDPRAMANLAVSYVNGHGGPRSYERARYWYEAAAKARSGHGAYGLGLLIYNGQGGPKDEVLGAALLQLAEEIGESSLPEKLKLSADLQAKVSAAKAKWVAEHGRPCSVYGPAEPTEKPWALSCPDEPVTSARER
jgi:hypothetical protein